MSNETGVKGLVKQALSEYSEVDILVSDAGIPQLS